jgi:hypothetical protein
LKLVNDPSSICEKKAHDIFDAAVLRMDNVNSGNADPNPQLPWCGGLNVFHNPHALHPLNEDVFGGYAQHFEEGGNIRSFIPDFHPYGAQCISVVPNRLKE